MDINLISNSTPPPGAGDRNLSTIGPSATTKTVSAPVETAAAIEQPKAIPNLEQVTQAVKSINKAMEGLSQGLEFSIDNDTHQTVVKIVDKQTKEIIRQMPSEEALQIAKALDKASGGLLIRQKA